MAHLVEQEAGTAELRCGLSEQTDIQGILVSTLRDELPHAGHWLAGYAALYVGEPALGKDSQSLLEADRREQSEQKPVLLARF